ncbi:hypothetical protein [Allochromatium tepidum]|uniref:XRE family transcriptional regulator n=1 Tax=Allochromatium tepidum TaxID=553982 RepID=A0ABM7QJG2_9GAMM|nr:hypothetical protein [Allochromatium tepidum]BCU05884.1 hypothetical protein Atep_05610 [Allochromatium tepidum]
MNETATEADSQSPARPDAGLHNPDPAYLRTLIQRSGLTQRAAATSIGIGERLLSAYLADREVASAKSAPYPVQYALEQLALSAPPVADPAPVADPEKLKRRRAARRRKKSLSEIFSEGWLSWLDNGANPALDPLDMDDTCALVSWLKGFHNGWCHFPDNPSTSFRSALQTKLADRPELLNRLLQCLGEDE